MQADNPLSPDTKKPNVPKPMLARYLEIAELIKDFSDAMLNEEYEELCLRALQKLCRKRPSPLVSGSAYTWACGIVYAIGANNFIFDRSQPIHMTGADIADYFGVAKSTAGSKASEIKRLLKLNRYNTEFQLEEMIAKNPAVWYLDVNGFIVDVRDMPRDIQEAAFRQGLIPYIPADRA
jgi:hypothetical protein